MTTTTDGQTGKQRWRDHVRHTADRGREVYEESWVMRLASWVMVSGLIAAMAYVSWLNIAPYVALVTTLGVGTPNWLTDLPLLGWIVTAWSAAIVTVVGVMVWALVQALQGAVQQSQSGRFLISGQADPAARSIARKARKIPYFFIRWGALLSLGAYAFDLVVALSLYPPAASLNSFLFALSSGMWSGIDMGNLAKLLVMLFAFEVVLILLIIALQWVRARQAATAQ